MSLEWPGDRLWQTVPASLVFADVSGFTALSEKLSKRGSIGAEELTHTLGTVFASMLDNAYLLGGSLLKFGGDALLLMFDGPNHPWRAANAARALRRAARQLGQLETSVGRLRIRASIGAHTGEVTFFRAGRLHKELIVAGPSLSTTLAMEAAASAGEVLLSPALSAEIDSRLLDGEKGPGRLLSDRGMPELSGDFPPAPKPREDPASSIPDALRGHLIDRDRTSEHRMVTVGFFKFTGLDALLAADVEAAGESVEELVTRVQAIAADCGVTFLGSDVDVDGGKIVLTAGAPVGHPDDSARMVAALTRVLSESTPLRIRAGVHRGKVFAGDIGPAYRRTYTVMGDAVNTAARVMSSAADGELLVSPVVAGQVQELSGFGEPRHVQVKGKSKPLEVIPVDPDSAPVLHLVEAGSAELVGRESEQDLLRKLAGELPNRRGAVVEVRGPAGIGKSALVRAVAGFEGVGSTLIVAAEAYGGDSPWGLARRVLEQAERSNAAESLESAVERAARAPGLEGVGGLMADVVPTMPTEGLAVPKHQRKAQTERLINEVLAELIGPSPVLVIEDIHVADDASLGWLRRLAAEAPERGWLVVLTRRGDGDPLAEWAHRMLLGPLSDSESRLLVKSVRGQPLRPREMTRLVEQGAGNPLYLRELAYSSGTDGELPDSIGAAFAARIDRLAPGDARLLRSASVLGVQLDPSDLCGLSGTVLPSASELVRRWGSLVELDGDQLRFTSPLARDAAYDALPHRTRTDLHKRAAQLLTDRVKGDKSVLPLLSVHLERAGLWRRCWTVSRSAAIRAGRVNASVEAAGLFERAIRAGVASSVGPEDLARVWWRTANEWHRADYLDRALDCYRSARTLTQKPFVKAAAGMSEARIAERKGEAVAATRRIRQALRILGVSERREIRLKADLEVMHGWISIKRGRIKDAQRWASTGLQDAIAAGNTAAQAEARLLTQWCAAQAGQTVDEGDLKRAARLFQRVKNSSRAAFSLNVLGAVAYYRGDWETAGQHYAEAMAMFEKAGHEAEAASARYNAAEILLDQGNLEEAEDVLEQVCDLYQAVGYREGLSLVERDRGRIALRRGDFGQARERLSGARAQFEEQQSAARVLEVDAWLAELDLSEQNTAGARSRLDRAVEKARAEGVGTVLPMLLRLQGYAHLAEGAFDLAAQSFAESLELARSVGGLYDVAMALSAEAEMAERQESTWPESSRRERDDLLSRLGMRNAPAPLLGNRGASS